MLFSRRCAGLDVGRGFQTCLEGVLTHSLPDINDWSNKAFDQAKICVEVKSHEQMTFSPWPDARTRNVICVVVWPCSSQRMCPPTAGATQLAEGEGDQLERLLVFYPDVQPFRCLS